MITFLSRQTNVVCKHAKNRRGEVEDKIIYKDAYRSWTIALKNNTGVYMREITP